MRPEWLLALGSGALVLACVAGAEGLLRLVAPDYFERRPAAVLDRLHRYSEVYGWDLRPGARQRDGDHWMTVNGQGYRGREVAPAPPPGRTRVLMLGDSIAFGTYVGDGETFADHIDRAGAGFEVVNFAVQGYGFTQSLLKLEREGLAYRPHVVILNVCLSNDFADTRLPMFLYDARHPKPYHRIEDGRLVLHDEHVKLTPLARAGRLLHERSQLYNRLVDLVRPRGGAPAGEAEAGEWVTRRHEALRDASAARELGLRVVGRMRAVAEAGGATFVVVLHPDKTAFKHGSEWVDAFYASPYLAGVTVVDMGREYHRAGLLGRDLLLDGIGHLTPEGHRQAAALIALRLARAGLAGGRAATATTARAKPSPLDALFQRQS